MGWRSWLKLTGYPGSDISVVERANQACSENPDAASCNAAVSETQTQSPPSPSSPETLGTPPPTPTGSQTGGSWGLAIVPDAVASEAGVLDTGSCSSGSGACVAEFDRCYGSGIDGSLRCCDGLICVRKSEFYGSCRDLAFLESGDADWSGEIVHCEG